MRLAHRRQEAGEQRMVLGEAAARRHRRGEDARAVALGERAHLVPGAVAVDAGADDERRPLAGVERGADRGEHVGVGSAAQRRRARGSTGAQARAQSSAGIETSTGPRGGCIAM